MNESLQVLYALHLLRPAWLWALLALPLLLLMWRWRARRNQLWQRSVDAHLLPHVLQPGDGQARRGLIAATLGWTLAVLALAGPSWRQAPQPLFESRHALVIALDLSRRMLADDLPPSRLLQARAKLSELLAQRVDGEVALLAYAGDSFTVAPLTADASNVALFVDALSPQLMPVDGQRADRAIAAASALLVQAGYTRGDILVLSDGADAAAQAAAAEARRQGFRVSALGLGTPAAVGARAAAEGDGRWRLDEASLRTLAARGGGRYARLRADRSDLDALAVLQPGTASGAPTSSRQTQGQAWRDEGYWLLLPVLLLTLLAFRRPGPAAAMVALLLLAPPLRAAEPGNWWQRADQRLHQRLQAGVQAYRRGDFVAAQRAFDGADSAVGQYNLGNALARQGHYAPALAAYDRALQQQPGMADALTNRAAVAAALRRQQTQAGAQSSSSSRAPSPRPGEDGRAGTPGAAAPASERGAGSPAAGPRQGGSSSGGSESSPLAATAAAAAAQHQADQAQQRRMQQALARSGGAAPAAATNADRALTPAQREQRQADEAWLRRVPDDPGALLRNKFRLEYERRLREGG